MEFLQYLSYPSLVLLEVHCELCCEKAFLYRFSYVFKGESWFTAAIFKKKSPASTWKTSFLDVSEQSSVSWMFICVRKLMKKCKKMKNPKKVLEEKKFRNPDLEKCVGGRT